MRGEGGLGHGEGQSGVAGEGVTALVGEAGRWGDVEGTRVAPFPP